MRSIVITIKMALSAFALRRVLEPAHSFAMVCFFSGQIHLCRMIFHGFQYQVNYPDIEETENDCST